MPFVILNKLELFYETGGEGTPLILLHNFLHTGLRCWEHYIPALSEHFKLYIPDLRGHGKTSWPDRELGITFEIVADDIENFMKELGLEDAFIAGVSLGSGTAIKLAYRGLGKAFVFAAMPNDYDREITCKAAEGFTEELMESWDSSWALAAKNGHTGRYGPDHWKEMLKLWKNSCIYDSAFPLQRSLCNFIKQPSLIIAGDRDSFFPLQYYIDFYRALPDGAIAILPGCDHLVTQERPDLFSRILLKFFLDCKRKLEMDR
ncbi:MAG: alpha/beta hydrolase [Chloroflexi bacterium]|nr:alpha/beta hydrolase [Chloroflexota bacterium]